MHRYYYSDYIKEILKHYDNYMEVIENIRENSKYRICVKAANLLKVMEVDKSTFREAEKLIKKAQTFDLRMKRGSKCLLCDFDNAKYIDKDYRYVRFHSNVCNDMVKHNFEYFYYFNTLTQSI